MKLAFGPCGNWGAWISSSPSRRADRVVPDPETLRLLSGDAKWITKGEKRAGKGAMETGAGTGQGEGVRAGWLWFRCPRGGKTVSGEDGGPCLGCESRY